MKYLLIVLLILFSLILLIIIIPFKVKIIRNDEHNDIEVVLINFFNIKIDIDKLIRYALSLKENRNVITVNSILYNMNIYIRLKNVMNSFLKRIVVRKLTLIIKTYIKEQEIQMYTTVFAYLLINYVKKGINNKFKKTKNEYYSVQKESDKNNFEFEMIFHMSFFDVVIAMFQNINDLIRVKKFIKKGKKENERTSD